MTPDKPRSQAKRRLRLAFFWTLIIIAYVLLRVHLINIPLDRDEGTFGYIGQVILNHGTLYKDVVDSKPPVVFFLNAFLLLFSEPTAAGVHLFLQIYNFLTLIALFALARVYFRSSSAGFWTALIYAVFSSSRTIQGFTASTEMFMLLPITLSLLFAVLAARNKNAGLVFASGVSGAMACWTKQTAVFSIAFVLVYLATSRLTKEGRKWRPAADFFKTVMIWLSGAVSASLIVFFYFFYKGDFARFFYWNFTYNFFYAGPLYMGNKISVIFYKCLDIATENFLLVLSGLVYGLWMALKKDRRAYFITGFFLFSFAGTLAGFAYAHYYAQIAPALALAAGFGINDILGRFQARFRKPAYLSAAVLVLLVPLIISRQYYFERDPDHFSRAYYGFNPFVEAQGIANYIAQHTTPGDRVFIFGSEPEIYFYSRRMSATPFQMISYLTLAHPQYRKCQEEAWRDISGNPPKYIIDIGLIQSVLWDKKADLSVFGRIDELIGRKYHLEKSVTIMRKAVPSKTVNHNLDYLTGWQQQHPSYQILLYRIN